MNRRTFLTHSASCSGYLAALAAFHPGWNTKLFAQQNYGKVVAEQKWGRLEQIAPGVYAMISTGFTTNDFTTVCNSGIIAGETGTLVIEGTMQPQGAAWIAAQAKKLTGRAPTDLVVTHFHGDHVNGHPGYEIDGKRPKTWVTAPTRKAAEKNFAKASPQIAKFHDVQIVGTDSPTKIDLGGRTVTIQPRRGHTSSDVTIEISDPEVIWTGDLYFNRIFPNYGDATPPLLNDFADHLASRDQAIIVPGHGPIADQAAVAVYDEFLKTIEAAAKKSHAAGTPAKQAAEAYKLPAAQEDWFIWSPENISRAFHAWYRVLS